MYLKVQRLQSKAASEDNFESSSEGEDGEEESPILLQGPLSMTRKGIKRMAGAKAMLGTVYRSGDVFLAPVKTPEHHEVHIRLENIEEYEYTVEESGVGGFVVRMEGREDKSHEEWQFWEAKDEGTANAGEWLSALRDALMSARR